jgi:hypothetical protein
MPAKPKQSPVTYDEYEDLQQRIVDLKYLNIALFNNVETLTRKLDDMTEERDSWVILYNTLYKQKRVSTLWNKIISMFKK